MKRIFLMRHAKSSWDDPGLSDHDRPLAPRGRRASKVIAAHLGREELRPALVLCSSSTRTQETLGRIAAALGDETEIRVERGLYAAGSGRLMERLHELPNELESVLLIGHNPAIHELVLTLAGTGPEIERVARKFPTAAIATLAFKGSWRELAPGSAELVAFVKPKDLG